VFLTSTANPDAGSVLKRLTASPKKLTVTKPQLLAIVSSPETGATDVVEPAGASVDVVVVSGRLDGTTDATVVGAGPVGRLAPGDELAGCCSGTDASEDGDTDASDDAGISDDAGVSSSTSSDSSGSAPSEVATSVLVAP